MTTWRRQRARPAPRGNWGLWAYEPLAFNGLTEVPENASHWLYCGSTLPGMKIAFSETPQVSMPPLIRSTPKSMNPPISIAPQDVISPSPWEKCRSPTERFAPSTKTG